MFTGLIEDRAVVLSVEARGGPLRLRVRPELTECATIVEGESIAHAGVCLTVVAHDASSYAVEIGAETLQRTTARQWKAGTTLNVERAMRLGDRLGGHLVLGHVDTVGALLSRTLVEGVLELEVELPESIAPLVCMKGSIALDGVSLTVNEAARDRFRVTLIPETRKRTTLDSLRVGDKINLEADLLARHITRWISFQGDRDKGGLSVEALMRQGFIK